MTNRSYICIFLSKGKASQLLSAAPHCGISICSLWAVVDRSAADFRLSAAVSILSSSAAALSVHFLFWIFCLFATDWAEKEPVAVCSMIAALY